jgi:hypothetical protein
LPHSTIPLAFEATDDLADFTSHGLLLAAHDFASRLGFFKAVDSHLSLTMKTRDYSWHDKLAMLWASILVDCDHSDRPSCAAVECAATRIVAIESAKTLTFIHLPPGNISNPTPCITRRTDADQL